MPNRCSLKASSRDSLLREITARFGHVVVDPDYRLGRGRAAMSVEMIEFVWYMKRFRLMAVGGYPAGAGAHRPVSALRFSPFDTLPLDLARACGTGYLMTRGKDATVSPPNVSILDAFRERTCCRRKHLFLRDIT